MKITLPPSCSLLRPLLLAPCLLIGLLANSCSSDHLSGTSEEISRGSILETGPQDQPEELGQVNWLRDYDEAIAKAKDEDRAVLILFQEVPGCSTCRNYGHNVLSNPLMVEAIENEFIPLAIFNNKGGKDKQILEKYGEPTWNNPVVRIVDGQGEDLVRRVAGNYSAQGLYDAMVSALEAEKKDVPGYMDVLGKELRTSGSVDEEYFQMYCFWSGERHLGQMEGVLQTEAGFMNGHEVVKVSYDSQALEPQELAEYAAKASCTPIDGDDSYRPSDKDLAYQLQHSDYKYLPLTPYQRTKINAALGAGRSVEMYLSPMQKKWLRGLKAGTVEKKIRFDQDFDKAWRSMG